MRKLGIFILLLVSINLFSQQEVGRWVLNPLTGELEYVTNTYFMQDSLIVLGYSSYFYPPAGYLNASIGYNLQNNARHGFNIGWYNETGCDENFVMGQKVQCFGERNTTIGMHDWGVGGETMSAKLVGSVAFGVNTKYAVLHVHSGYGPGQHSYAGEDIGGVAIGRPPFDLTSGTGLEIYAHHDSASTPTILRTESDELVIDNYSMTFSGSLETGYFENIHTPAIHSAAGDTSLLPVPLKTGDIYIDTSAKDVYISTGNERGKWKKVN